VAFIVTIWDYLNLFYPPFVPQFGQYPHESVIVHVDVVKYDRVVDLARFLDEFFHHDLLLLILPVLHS
jgi:hypothetical protein